MGSIVVVQAVGKVLSGRSCEKVGSNLGLARTFIAQPLFT